MGEAFLRATKSRVSVRTPIRRLFHVRGRFLEGIGWFGEKQAGFLLANNRHKLNYVL